MEETIIKWSGKKVIWNTVFVLVYGIFLLWILLFIVMHLEQVSILMVILLLLMILLILTVGCIVYQRIQILRSDREYLRCTVKGFFYKPNPYKASKFYAWKDVEEFAFRRIPGGRRSRDFYRIEVSFYDKDFVKTKSLWTRLRNKFTTVKPSIDLIIPIHLLDVGLPERVFETMSYFEREWRIEQNRGRNQSSKSKKK